MGLFVAFDGVVMYSFVVFEIANLMGVFFVVNVLFLCKSGGKLRVLAGV